MSSISQAVPGTAWQQHARTCRERTGPGLTLAAIVVTGAFADQAPTILFKRAYVGKPST